MACLLLSTTIRGDGLGLVSYQDTPEGTLKVAHGRGSLYSNALVIGRDGLGLISYRFAYGPVRMAHCENVACTRASFSTIDEGPHVVSTVDHKPNADLGQYASRAFGADGLGLISYLDGGPGGAGSGALKVAHCQDAACTRATVSVLDAATHR